MGVYIKGIKKPRHCYECTIGECRVRLPKGDINYNVHPQCPLIEVKEPHGRLVDENEVIKRFHAGAWGAIYELDVRNAPTIIEAEDE